MNEIESAPPSSPSPESPQPTTVVRCFFRDIDSAGNLEDGMEFHAAGVVLKTTANDEHGDAQLTVLYLNPLNGKVEKRVRRHSSVILYVFPQKDAVYWSLWEQTKLML